MTSSDTDGDVCGFEMSVDWVAEEYFNEAPLPWKRWKKSGEGTGLSYFCQRDTWDDTERCVWHADVDHKPIDALLEQRAEEPERLDGAKIRYVDWDNLNFERCSFQHSVFKDIEMENSNFEDADLLGVEFRGKCQLSESNFKNANLSDVSTDELALFNTKLSGATLSGQFQDSGFDGADVSNCTLRGDFSGSSYHEANLTDARAEKVDFSNCFFGGANLTRVDLRGANLTGARLYQALLSDIQINRRTDFGGKTVYEEDANIDIVIDTSWDVHRLEAAAWVYRRLQSICQEQALSEKARHFHVRKREARRKLAWANRNIISAIISEADRLFTKHGESPRRVLLSSIIIILVSSVFYTFGGIRENGLIYSLFTSSGISDPLPVIGQSLYFSIVSFTTVGYGDVQPAGVVSKSIAGLESLAGALFVALFIFVLGRRVTW